MDATIKLSCKSQRSATGTPVLKDHSHERPTVLKKTHFPGTSSRAPLKKACVFLQTCTCKLIVIHSWPTGRSFQNRFHYLYPLKFQHIKFHRRNMVFLNSSEIYIHQCQFKQQLLRIYLFKLQSECKVLLFLSWIHLSLISLFPIMFLR